MATSSISILAVTAIAATAFACTPQRMSTNISGVVLKPENLRGAQLELRFNRTTNTDTDLTVMDMTTDATGNLVRLASVVLVDGRVQTVTRLAGRHDKLSFFDVKRCDHELVEPPTNLKITTILEDSIGPLWPYSDYGYTVVSGTVARANDGANRYEVKDAQPGVLASRLFLILNENGSRAAAIDHIQLWRGRKSIDNRLLDPKCGNVDR